MQPGCLNTAFVVTASYNLGPFCRTFKCNACKPETGIALTLAIHVAAEEVKSTWRVRRVHDSYNFGLLCHNFNCNDASMPQTGIALTLALCDAAEGVKQMCRLRVQFLQFLVT